MRPLKLTLQAFGSYRDRLDLDFESLGPRGFLLIHGPTGAGKTTVLDGICYALYGNTSGDDRTPRQMRSDHAPADVATSVRFEFALGPHRYCVERRPEQERPRRRGEGTRIEPASATLWEIGPGGALHVRASQQRAVTEAVEELLGFRADQFRQVVMLPQDRFRRFLLADSAEREEILEVLFQTEGYRLIQEALVQSARRIKEKWEQVLYRRQERLVAAGADSPEALDGAVATLLEQHRQAADDVTRREAAAAEARALLAGGRTAAEKIKERDAAEDDVRRLEAQRPAFNARKEELRLARLAIPLEGAARAAGAADEAARTARAEARQAETAQRAAHKNLQAARTALASAEAREGDREAAERLINQLGEWRGQLRALDAARRTAAEHQGEYVRRTDELAALGKRLEAVRTERPGVESIHLEAERSAAALAGAGTDCRQAEQQEEDRKNLETLSRQLQAAQQAQTARDAALAEAEAAHGRAAAALAAARDVFLLAQAGVLAAALAPGEPCPVCGSRKHPSPAPPAAGAPTEAGLRDLERRVDDQTRSLDNARRDAATAAREAAAVAARVKDLRKRLGAAAGVSLAEIQKRRRRARAERDRLQAAKDRLPELRRRLDGLRREEAELQSRQADLSRRQAAAATARDAARHQVRELEKQIPAGYRESAALEKADREAQAEVKQLKDALRLARERATAVESAAAAAAALEKAAGEQAQAADARLADRRNAFLNSLAAAGFADVTAFESARRDSRAIRALERGIREWEAAWSAAKERLTRARRAVRGLAAPDLPALEERVREAEEAHRRWIHAEADLKARLLQAEAHREALAGLAGEAGRLEAQHRVMGRLGEVAGGRNNFRVTFQRFVQGALFDEVLEAASRRLAVMSKHRYLLRRAGAGADRRSVGGLDLEVDDGYTGKARPAATLSGGESFLAALALALGLADVVQGYAGGVRLETLFIDEGFGSLDEESLDLALRALSELQAGGRLVAVISHVAELRERINTRLEVVPSRTGSTARLILG